MKNQLALCTCLMLLQAGELFAQLPGRSKTNKTTILDQNKKVSPGTAKPYLFQYGIASAFIEGLYEGKLSIDELKQHGNFGIGAPDHVDGELTIVDGKAYQSNAKGQTMEAPGNLKTPFAFVTTFKADTSVLFSNVQSISEFFERIETVLPNRNAIYALRISGTFSKMKTRAFPPTQDKPGKPLAQMLDQQRFFEATETKGVMVGFYMPGYLSGINITGLHFHFLSQDRSAGGHVVGLAAQNLVMEITELKDFHLQTLDTDDFRKFRFNGGNSLQLRQIEKGEN
jgi:acetolactate decarboxylase